MKDVVLACLNAILPYPQAGRLLVRSKSPHHGDYAFPCFALSKEWKLNPAECALRLREQITLPEQIEKIEALGPYLNFFMKRDRLAQEVIGEILRKGRSFGASNKQDQSLVIEYSSPNIAKPFHLGHLRTTLIGHALDRIYRHLGYKVISLNHLGDWGTQFGFVYAGCELWGRPEKGDIFDLVGLYIRANNLREAQETAQVAAEDADKSDVNQMAREYFRRLEQGDSQALAFWQWCLDISNNYLGALYKRIGVRFDHFLGESFYRDKLQAVEESIREAGILEESRGDLGVDLGKKLGFVRIFAADGRSLYITRDIAAAIYRDRTYNPCKILVVVGAPQNLYFQQLKEVLRRMKEPAGDKLVHVSYGNVPGISTRRAGPSDRIWLHVLLDEAHERALEAYREQVEKRPAGLDEEQVAEAVGLGAIAFNYLCRSNVKEFNFSWEEALNFQGDTGPYIQYALARINGIIAKAAESGLKVPERADFNAGLLGEDEAHQLVSLLSRFPEVLEQSANDYEPSHVALYLLELARSFSAAYQKLRVLGEDRDLALARLTLFTAVRFVLQKGIELIGMPVIDRM